MDVFKKLIQELEKGKNSIHIVRNLILHQHYPRIKVEDSYENNKNDDNNQDYYKDFNHHSMVALDSYHNTISMLKNCTNFDGVFVEKRKLDHLGQSEDVSPNNSCISGVSANQEAYNMSSNDDRRECTKKRKIISSEPREEEVTHLTYDGFGWRKYGQKTILNYQHPRHYYRCTHKYDQNCQAIKQVQQVSDNPTKYKLIYHGNHICNNNDNDNYYNVFKTSPYVINCPEEHSSTFVLNFDRSNQVNNPSLFPTSSYSNNNLSITEDATTTTTTTNNNARVAIPLNHIYESWSTTASPISLEEEYFNNIIADFSQSPHDLWTV